MYTSNTILLCWDSFSLVCRAFLLADICGAVSSLSWHWDSSRWHYTMRQQYLRIFWEPASSLASICHDFLVSPLLRSLLSQSSSCLLYSELCTTPIEELKHDP